MYMTFSEGVESEAPPWEPEPLPLVEQLPFPPARPRREDSHESDQANHVVVIDLC